MQELAALQIGHCPPRGPPSPAATRRVRSGRHASVRCRCASHFRASVTRRPQCGTPRTPSANVCWWHVTQSFILSDRTWLTCVMLLTSPWQVAHSTPPERGRRAESACGRAGDARAPTRSAAGRRHAWRTFSISVTPWPTTTWQPMHCCRSGMPGGDAGRRRAVAEGALDADGSHVRLVVERDGLARGQCRATAPAAAARRRSRRTPRRPAPGLAGSPAPVATSQMALRG